MQTAQFCSQLVVAPQFRRFPSLRGLSARSNQLVARRVLALSPAYSSVTSYQQYGNGSPRLRRSVLASRLWDVISKMTRGAFCETSPRAKRVGIRFCSRARKVTG